MTSEWAEVMEGYADTTKELIHKWSDYASHVAKHLDSGYDADRASADLGTAVSLAIETGARLTWEAVDAFATFVDAPNRAVYVESEQFSTRYKGAKLTLKDLKDRAGDTLPAARAAVIPPQLGPDDSTFKIRANIAGCPAGIYRGNVSASTANQAEEVPVLIKVP